MTSFSLRDSVSVRVLSLGPQMARLLILLASLAFLLPALAMAPDEEAAIDRASQRGRLIYELDRAAWVTTDEMNKSPDRIPTKADTGGWVVERNGDELVVTYWESTGGKVSPFFIGTVERGNVISSRFVDASEHLALTPDQLRIISAVRTAATTIDQPTCTGGHYNTVAIPPAGPHDPIDVYFLTPQVTADAFPFGGHHLVAVGGDGGQSRRDFTKTCLTLAPYEQGAPVDSKTTSLTVSHILDPTPTEIHVFMSYSARLRVFVVTTQNGRFWEVVGDRITEVSKQ